MEIDQSTALEKLRLADPESKVGGQIEEYCEHYPVGVAEKPVFERFLQAASLQNRSAALAALIYCGKMSGYEADSLLLHYESRDGLGSPEEFAAIDFLRRLRDMGSDAAARALNHLDADPYVQKLYGD